MAAGGGRLRRLRGLPVWGSGFRVQGLGFGVKSFLGGFGVGGVKGLGGQECLGFGVRGVKGLMAQGFGGMRELPRSCKDEPVRHATLKYLSVISHLPHEGTVHAAFQSGECKLKPRSPAYKGGLSDMAVLPLKTLNPKP